MPDIPLMESLIKDKDEAEKTFSTEPDEQMNENSEGCKTCKKDKCQEVI